MLSQAQEYRESTTTRQQTPQQIPVHNPVTGEAFASIPVHDAATVAQTVAQARHAQEAWAATPVKERCAVLSRFADLLIAQQEAIISVIRRETGKVHAGAYGEIAHSVLAADYYTQHAPKWLKPQRQPGLFPLIYKAVQHYPPYGVVGNIAPWNYPLSLSMIDMIPALIAGNAVVVKPSELTPFTSMEVQRLLEEAGLPPQLFQVATGEATTAQALINQVDYLMFTGSTATGRKVAQQCAERLIPCSLELGGNDPMIVLRDADLERAAASAVKGSFENAGQYCMSVERVFVEEAIYEDFLQAVERWQRRLCIGAGDGFDVHMGSLNHPRELSRVEAHLEDALAKGARLVTGGKRLPELGPLFYDATIVADMREDMLLMQEESFGPIVGVMPVKDAAEALRMANASPYGLSASIFTKDIAKGQALAQQLQAGDVHINTVVLNIGTFGLETGGVKDSGIGRRGGKQGLMKYTNPKAITVERIPTPKEVTVYTSALRRLFERVRPLQRRFPFLWP